MTTQIDYSSLDPTKIEQWAAPLGALLQDSSTALRDGDTASRTAVVRALNEFMDRNTFQTLDQIASDAVQSILGASIDEALKSIGERSTDLQKLTKDFRKISGEARADAASIRMEAVTRVLDASTNAIRALGELRDAVKDDASARELVKKLEDLVNKTQAVRNELEKSPPKA
jgi:hypothetical protein